MEQDQDGEDDGEGGEEGGGGGGRGRAVRDYGPAGPEVQVQVPEARHVFHATDHVLRH